MAWPLATVLTVPLLPPARRQSSALTIFPFTISSAFSWAQFPWLCLEAGGTSFGNSWTNRRMLGHAGSARCSSNRRWPLSQSEAAGSHNRRCTAKRGWDEVNVADQGWLRSALTGLQRYTTVKQSSTNVVHVANRGLYANCLPSSPRACSTRMIFVRNPAHPHHIRSNQRTGGHVVAHLQQKRVG